MTDVLAEGFGLERPCEWLVAHCSRADLKISSGEINLSMPALSPGGALHRPLRFTLALAEGTGLSAMDRPAPRVRPGPAARRGNSGLPQPTWAG